jgi:hypothetical protein
MILGQVLEALGDVAEAARVYEAGVATATRAGNDHARSELGHALDSARARGDVR